MFVYRIRPEIGLPHHKRINVKDLAGAIADGWHADPAEVEGGSAYYAWLLKEGAAPCPTYTLY